MHSAARMHAIARVISGEPDCSHLPALLCLPSGACRLHCAGPHRMRTTACGSWRMHALYVGLLKPSMHPPHIHPTKPPGGPIYISDMPGHHDFQLLRRLVLPDGSGGQYTCMVLEPSPHT